RPPPRSTLFPYTTLFRSELHHGHTHMTAVMQQLASQGLGESLDRVLRAAVGGLQGDAAVRERGPDLHDRAAIAREHAFERRQRADRKSTRLNSSHLVISY